MSKIEGTGIVAPYHMIQSNCVYCAGDHPVDHTRFEVKLSTGQVIGPVCNVCITEYIFEDPSNIATITNIGKIRTIESVLEAI